jgi:putative transposase
MDMVQMYINNSGKWVYIFDIIDVFTREIVGQREGLRSCIEEAFKELDEAVKN